MTAQVLSLFADDLTPRVRKTDPVSSVQAARSVSPGVPNAILDVLAQARRPLTADQIAGFLPRVRTDTLRSALARLHTRGRVREAGMGESDAGRPMQKWALA